MKAPPNDAGDQPPLGGQSYDEAWHAHQREHGAQARERRGLATRVYGWLAALRRRAR